MDRPRPTRSGSRPSLEDAQTKLTRAEALAARQLITESDLDAARTAVNQALPDVKGAQSVVVQATAMVDQASLDLEHTIIRSPVDGVVVERDVDVGQTVAASIQSPVLFRIATDLTKMQVQVQVDESDIAAVSKGNAATFEVGSYPGVIFHGVVSQVRLQPILEQSGGDSTSGTTTSSATTNSATSTAGASTTTSVAPATPAGSVVSYTAIVDVANKNEKLRPGMTAEVSFGGFTRESAVRIPNSALAFRPPSRCARRDRRAGHPCGVGRQDRDASGLEIPGGALRRNRRPERPCGRSMDRAGERQPASRRPARDERLTGQTPTMNRIASACA